MLRISKIGAHAEGGERGQPMESGLHCPTVSQLNSRIYIFKKRALPNNKVSSVPLERDVCQLHTMRMMKIQTPAAVVRMFFVLLMLLPVGTTFAQGVATLTGRVTSTDGKPMQYASVVAVSLNPVVGSVTDDQGRFQMQLPADSLLTVRVSFTGYEPADTTMRIPAGTTIKLHISLGRGATSLGPVTVSDERSRSTTFTTIDVERMEHSVGPQSGVESMLKTLPDVSSNNEMSSQYSVRGGSFDENLVYINGVEILRPMLIRSGQQEGTSIINPDLVDHILFSPGGFDATYGDRMSSVLDITYSRHNEFSGRASVSFLGASLSLKGGLGDRFNYSIGFRRHSNRYLFRTLDTEGNYTTAYSDLQALFSYRVNDRLDLQLLTILMRNIYGLVPTSQTTAFGGFSEAMEFEVFYEGEERDSYSTILSSLSADYHPTDDMRLKWTTSFQSNDETEAYDILSQFWLYELNVGNVNEDGETERFDRGVGSFLEHARDYLQTNIFSTELRGSHYAAMGNWNWGLKAQHEQVRDRMREWKWVDSAGYAMPTCYDIPGVVGNEPHPPVLQLFCRSNHRVETTRLSGFLQRNFDFYNSRGDLWRLVAGARLQWYDISFDDPDASEVHVGYAGGSQFDTSSLHNRQLLFSPRVSLNYKPAWKRDILFRLSTGVYSQAPFYREYRYDDGSLNHALRAQQSYQVMGTMDWNFHIGSSPFKFTADLYYKYIDNLVPYRIDNLRVRYDAHNNAVGYAAGLSLRLSGEVVEGLESWASLSLMRTQEDIEGDAFGWIARPTDQRISFKLFFQDYVPTVPFWRMTLNFIVGSGLPFTFPTQRDFSVAHYYPPYLRVDWGNTLQLSRFERIKESRLMHHIDDILLSLEVFNLFDYKNVVSYIWVADYNNQYYHVPNYLTARQLNLKLTMLF